MGEIPQSKLGSCVYASRSLMRAAEIFAEVANYIQ